METYVAFNRDTFEFERVQLARHDVHGFLQAAYKIAECDCVDHARVTRDGLSAWVDDNGLYTKANKLSFVGEYPQPLAGGILFSGGTDDEGYTLGVPEKYLANDMELLRGAVVPLIDMTVRFRE